MAYPVGRSLRPEYTPTEVCKDCVSFSGVFIVCKNRTQDCGGISLPFPTCKRSKKTHLIMQSLLCHIVHGKVTTKRVW